MTRRIHLVDVAELQPTDRASYESRMALALAEARRNRAAPFGAIIIDRDTGDVACKGVNQAHESPRFHGEIATINACAKAHPGLNWKRMAIYTTAEPCPMCAGAIAWAGIGEVVFGTSVKKLIRSACGKSISAVFRFSARHGSFTAVSFLASWSNKPMKCIETGRPPIPKRSSLRLSGERCGMTAILCTDFREIAQCIGSELMRPGSNELRQAHTYETECRVVGCLAALSPRKDQ